MQYNNRIDTRLSGAHVNSLFRADIGKVMDSELKYEELRHIDSSIDCFRIIFAAFVVGIHAGVFSGDDFISWFMMHWLFRLAVPFFFVISGYYLGKKLWNTPHESSNIIFEYYRRRLIPPLLFWGGMGLVIEVLRLYKHGTGIKSIIIYTIKTIIFYPQGAMWFVWACIVASCIIQLFWKYKKHKLLGILALTGYAFALIANTYYFIIDGSPAADIVNIYMNYCISARNGIFVGTLFLFEGIMLSSDKVRDFFNNMSKWKIWAVFVFSELFFIMEICFSYKKSVLDDSSLFIIFPVLIPLIVMLVLKYRMTISLPYNKLRKLSTGIYFSHRFVLNLVFLFHFPAYLAFVIALAVSTGTGIIVQRLNKPILNKFFV